MIGFYDYTIVLTLLSLVTSIFGMTQAMDGRFRIAIFCLALSGLFDTFDGKVARTKKNRTDAEKLYGIQLDSLADVVCFGVFPILICYLMGVRGILGGIALGFYGICGVIRLAYFNVLETNRQMQPTGEEKVYHGLPITSIAVILPLTFLLGFVVSDAVFQGILFVMLLVVGLCFVLDFKMQKPSNRTLAVLILLVACTVATIVLFAEHHVSRSHDIETPLYDQIEEWADE
jgi:CDP-diacylglycerol--serine O-phosphatidyltransferase